jgi:hypothetical protein
MSALHTGRHLHPGRFLELISVRFLSLADCEDAMSDSWIIITTMFPLYGTGALTTVQRVVIWPSGRSEWLLWWTALNRGRAVCHSDRTRHVSGHIQKLVRVEITSQQQNSG